MLGPPTTIIIIGTQWGQEVSAKQTNHSKRKVENTRVTHKPNSPPT